MSLSSVLTELEAIERLPVGWRDPKLADDPPHLSEPWVVLPAALMSAARALLVRLDHERLPMPSSVTPIAPYLGDGGVALWWREDDVSIGSAPAVVLTITLVAGTTCTVF